MSVRTVEPLLVLAAESSPQACLQAPALMSLCCVACLQDRSPQDRGQAPQHTLQVPKTISAGTPGYEVVPDVQNAQSVELAAEKGLCSVLEGQTPCCQMSSVDTS